MVTLAVALVTTNLRLRSGAGVIILHTTSVISPRIRSFRIVCVVMLTSRVWRKKMAASKDDISYAFDRGVREEKDYMIMVCDSIEQCGRIPL